MEQPADVEHVVITAYENGPYVVKGRARILDADGNEWNVEGKASVALCRCGGSLNKPFCDGAHSELGFQAAERAVAEAEEQG